MRSFPSPNPPIDLPEFSSQMLAALGDRLQEPKMGCTADFPSIPGRTWHNLLMGYCGAFKKVCWFIVVAPVPSHVGSVEAKACCSDFLKIISNYFNPLPCVVSHLFQHDKEKVECPSLNSLFAAIERGSSTRNAILQITSTDCQQFCIKLCSEETSSPK